MEPADPYAAHKAFVAPARDGSPVWSVIAGLAVAEILFAFSPLLIWPFFGDGLGIALEGRSPVTLFLALMLYGVPGLAIVQWVRVQHRRSGWTLIGPPDAAFHEALRVAWAVFLILLALEILYPSFYIEDIEDVRNVPVWLVSLPLAVIAVVVQAGSEELIFRGYLQQQLGALSDRPIVWMVIPSLLFGILHFWNSDGTGDGLLYVAWAFFLGVACADLTARTGTIGAAIGLHVMNNLFVFCLLGTQNQPDSGFALFLYPDLPPAPGLEIADMAAGYAIYDVIISAIFIGLLWLSARIAIRR